MRLNILPTEASIKRLALIGRLDVKGVNDIQYEFLQATTMVPTSTVVDISKVSFMSSSGMGMLLAAAKTLERHGAKLVLLAPSTAVYRSLEISCIHTVIPVAREEAAVLALIA